MYLKGYLKEKIVSLINDSPYNLSKKITQLPFFVILWKGQLKPFFIILFYDIQ